MWRKILDPCWIAHATYRVRKRTKSPIDYTQWVEGYGSEAKPEDYDQQPGKYEVKWLDHRGYWFGFIENDTIRMWAPELVHRVRLRQSEPQGETDGEFALRWLRMHEVTIRDGMTQFSWIGKASWEDLSRAARLIAEAKA